MKIKKTESTGFQYVLRETVWWKRDNYNYFWVFKNVIVRIKMFKLCAALYLFFNYGNEL